MLAPASMARPALSGRRGVLCEPTGERQGRHRRNSLTRCARFGIDDRCSYSLVGNCCGCRVRLAASRASCVAGTRYIRTPVRCSRGCDRGRQGVKYLVHLCSWLALPVASGDRAHELSGCQIRAVDTGAQRTDRPLRASGADSEGLSKLGGHRIRSGHYQGVAGI